MSVFANPATNAKEAASGYVRALFDVLGDRDPLEVMSRTHQEIRGITEGLNTEQTRTPEKPGKWSIAATVQHLADAEVAFAFRVRMILSHDTPMLQGFDQDLWASELGYAEADIEGAIDQFRALREANLRLIRRLEPEQKVRFGIHDERGNESVEHLIRMMAGHDLVHCAQIERIRRGRS